MKVNKLKEKMTLHPIMTIIILIGFTILLSGILSSLNIQAGSKKISTTSLEYNSYIAEVTSLFSLSGLKYIFTTSVSNFISFAPLSSLLIILIGIGVMEKSGFLKVVFTLLTKNTKKYTVTFFLVLTSLILGVIGDLSYIIILPLAAILFKYGKRNPTLGITASFAGLTFGRGINIIFTSIDSSLLSLSNLATQMVDETYTTSSFGFIFIMIVATILSAFLITHITEKYLVYKLDKYEIESTTPEEEFIIGKKEKKGLALSLIAIFFYLLIFIYNIIPGLPFSGKFLDNSQGFYIDKLFSSSSFFSNGFVFVVATSFIILGFFFGIGAKTIKNNKDFCEALGHSLDGIGQTIVLIFFISILINIVKYTNIGTVVVTFFANIINKTTFTGIPLIILLFVISAISSLIVPSSLTSWSILSGVTIPIFMRNGLTPEFTQVIFSFASSITLGLTPLFSYFVIYLALLETYNQNPKPISLFKAIKYQIPYALSMLALLLTILIIWYIVGLPIGYLTYPTL